MSATKTRTSVYSATVMTAGAGDVTSGETSLVLGYGSQVSIRFTNGATGPTVPPQCQIQVANDSPGTIFTNFGGPLVGAVGNSAVTSWSIDLPIGVAAVKFVTGSNTAQNVTVAIDISNVTAL